MSVVNFMLAPLLVWLMLPFFPLDPYLRFGLTVSSICAGAPFLSEHGMALSYTLKNSENG